MESTSEVRADSLIDWYRRASSSVCFTSASQAIFFDAEVGQTELFCAICLGTSVMRTYASQPFVGCSNR